MNDPVTDYFDISPHLNSRTAVFPGDRPLNRHIALDFQNGDALVLSSIHTTLHVGAHVDAPSHYHPQGMTMEKRDLSIYRGPCQVMRVRAPKGARIQVEHLEGRPITAPRILFHTGSFKNPEAWTSDFNSLSEELIEFLAARKVRLVGLDTPSVDPADSKALEAHQAIYRNNLAILEGVILDQVPEGIYELTALPLKLDGADASPVRAVLWKIAAESQSR